MQNKPREFNGDYCKETCHYFVKAQWANCCRYGGIGKEVSGFDFDTHRRIVSLNGIMYDHEQFIRWWRCAQCVDDKQIDKVDI